MQRDYTVALPTSLPNYKNSISRKYKNRLSIVLCVPGKVISNLIEIPDTMAAINKVSGTTSG